MHSVLILSKPELNPDIFFNTPSQWNIGADWTIYNNNIAGAVCTNATSTSIDLVNSPLKYSKAYKYTIRVQSCNGNNTFLLIGGNIIPIPLSLTPQIYEGVVTTSSSVNTVSIISSGGDYATFNYLKISESPESYDIELMDDIAVPITYSIADIKDPSKRNAAYSKTITISGTKNNNLYFSQIFEIGGDGTYNPNKKAKAVVLNDGLEVFNGICQLKTINRVRNGLNNYDSITYEIVLLGKLADLFYALGDTQLSDLDYSEFNHYYTLENQRNSWYTAIQKNGVTYSNTVNGSNLTITSCQNSSGRVQLNFSGTHGLVAGDWLLIPDFAITSGSEFYYGEHEVYSIVSTTSIIIRCPFDVLGGNTLTATARKHTKTGEGYTYPMLDYNEVTGNSWNVKNFYPAIYLKTYIDKMFKKAGFIYDSNFLNSTMFKKLIIPYNGGQLKLTQDQIDAKKFRASSTSRITASYSISPAYASINMGYGNFRYMGHCITGLTPGPSQSTFTNTAPVAINVPINDDSTLPNFDNGNTFNTGSYRWTAPTTGTYDLDVTANVNQQYVLPTGVTQANHPDTPGPPTWGTWYSPTYYNINTNSGTNAGAGSVRLQIYNYTTNTVVFNSSDVFFVGTSSVTLSAPGFNCAGGNQYGVRLIVTNTMKGQFYNTPAGPNYNPYTGNIAVNYKVAANATFKNDVPNAAIQEGDYLLVNMCVPQKVKCTELLTSIIKMHNLYIESDKDNDKKLYIEPRNLFYDLGVDVDWTKKLNTDQTLSILPMGDLNAKFYDYKFAPDKSAYGVDHLNKYSIGYGDYKYEIDNDFIKGTNDTQVIFSSSVLSEAQQNAGSGRIISLCTGESLRLLYFNVSSTQNIVPQNTWSHVGLSNTYNRRIFPYAGHLDKVEAPNNDLNWFYPKGVYFTYDSWAESNLFNKYYKQMIQEITDKNSKIITCYLHLTPYDIFKLDFRNRFIIDGHFLRLNKITDYNVTSTAPVLCEFVKVESKPAFVPRPFINVSHVDNSYNPTARVINGTQMPEVATSTNNSNAARTGTGVNVNGQNNSINNYGARTISVNGDNNVVGSNCRNIIISGDNNTIQSGLTNVALINTSGVTVTESNTVYMNGILIDALGAMTNNNINVVSAGVDTVLNPFGSPKQVNMISAGINSVLNIGSMDNTNLIDAGNDRV